MPHLPVFTPLFLMSPPRKDWHIKGRANFRSHSIQQADASVARKEWTELADAITQAGGQVIVLPPHPDKNLTGLIYTAEAGLLEQPVRDTPHYFLSFMSPPHRKPEARWIEHIVSRYYHWTTSFQDKYIWEAQGDVLYLDHYRTIMTYGEGHFARTSKQGLEHLASSVSKSHILLKFKADPWFHGNTFMNVYFKSDMPCKKVLFLAKDALAVGEFERLEQWLLQQDRILGTETHIEHISTEESLAYATNSLQVGNTVIAPRGISQRCQNIWSSLGLHIITLDLSELFLKGGGAPVCLTCRLLGLKQEQIPTKFVWQVGSTISDFEQLIHSSSTSP